MKAKRGSVPERGGGEVRSQTAGRIATGRGRRSVGPTEREGESGNCLRSGRVPVEVRYSSHSEVAAAVAGPGGRKSSTQPQPTRTTNSRCRQHRAEQSINSGSWETSASPNPGRLGDTEHHNSHLTRLPPE